MRRFTIGKMRKNKIAQTLVVVALLVVVLGSFTGLFRNVDVKPTPAEKPRTVKVTKLVLNSAASSTLPTGYSLIGSGVSPLTTSSQDDIVLCGESKDKKDAYMAAVEPISETDFKKIADLHLPILDGRTPCGGDDSEASTNQRIVDTDGDGIKELVMNTGGGGASTDAFGIFKLDLSAKKIIHTSMKDPDGAIVPTELLLGSSVTHSDTFDFRDLDNDGKQELVTMNSLLNNQDAPKDPKSWDWEVEVYRWSGSLFEYDKALTMSHPELLTEFEKEVLKNIK